jgi:DNA/RNA-binding domain of Phe-tRNA-synthetase-like protein
VFDLRPDYRAMLVAADGIASGPSDAGSEALLRRAEQVAVRLSTETPVDALPHIAAWHDAYRAFGAKPQRTRNSLEALTRRAGAGLPRVNRLTDLYNAVSVRHQVPLGGEDLSRYRGSPRLLRAVGSEAFETMVEGETAIEHPVPGEVVWCDAEGVTCRRWNWRQGRRTQVTPDTTSALLILDALAPLSDDALSVAADDLIGRLQTLGADVRIATRLIGEGGSGRHGATIRS